MTELFSMDLWMPRVLIKDFTAGKSVHEPFLLKSHSIKTTRTGKPYLSVELCDQSGTIRGNMWDTAETDLLDGIVVDVDMIVDSYNGTLNAKIRSIVAADQETSAHYRSELIPTVKDTDKLASIFQQYVNRIGAPYDALLKQFDLEEMKVWPAAKAFHHAQVGGLLKHTVEVLQLSDGMAETLSAKFPVNRSLLFTAAILHDYGKLKEFKLSGAGLVEEYTPEGILLGHITMGTMLAAEAAQKIGMDKDDALMLEHCILAHHGQPDYGSPVKPATMEALILHAADALSAASEEYATAAENGEAGTMADALGLGKVYIPSSGENHE